MERALGLKVMTIQDLLNENYGSIHDWGTKKECLTEKRLHMTTLDFCLSCIIIIVMDCCMPINKIMSF
jgi:hypothetical protein